MLSRKALTSFDLTLISSDLSAREIKRSGSESKPALRAVKRIWKRKFSALRSATPGPPQGLDGRSNWPAACACQTQIRRGREKLRFSQSSLGISHKERTPSTPSAKLHTHRAGILLRLQMESRKLSWGRLEG